MEIKIIILLFLLVFIKKKKNSELRKTHFLVNMFSQNTELLRACLVTQSTSNSGIQPGARLPTNKGCGSPRGAVSGGWTLGGNEDDIPVGGLTGYSSDESPEDFITKDDGYLKVVFTKICVLFCSKMGGGGYM